MFAFLFSYVSALPFDQVRYVVLLLSCFPLGFIFRHLLVPARTGVAARHAFFSAVGLVIGTLCFQWQMLILCAFVAVSYMFLLTTPAAVVQRYTMAWALVCISAGHLYRLLTDYGGYHMDFTTPLMILVQRVTLVGFAVHDGMARKSSELNDDQKTQKLSRIPSLLEYVSYTINYTMLAGPSWTFTEHLSYMEGRGGVPEAEGNMKSPSALYAIATKCASAVMFCVLYLSIPYSVQMVLDPELSIVERALLIEIVIMKLKFRYYFIWMLLDSVNNTAGIGFNGYDDRGFPKWDQVSNIDPLVIETATSIRVYATQWNAATSRWLRRVCYQRVHEGFFLSPNLLTFVLSALWHGFYPGYYLTFLFYGFVNEASRRLRKLLRHHFQGSKATEVFYDILTWFATRWLINLGGIPFFIMWPKTCLLYWSYFYYVPVLLVVLGTVCLPSSPHWTQTGSKAK